MGLFQKIFIWRIPLKNYLLAILLPTLFLASGIGLYALFVGDVGIFNIDAVAAIPAVLWSGLFFGPLGEELGWRGFLLTELQKGFLHLKAA